MMSLSLRSLMSVVIILPLCGIVRAGEKKMPSICSGFKYNSLSSPSTCTKGQFKCLNSETCIQREWYCDNGNDCGDNSDERYCSVRGPCPTNPHFTKCTDSPKCIPFDWNCNGFSDCPYGDDEEDCDVFNSVINPNVETHMRRVLDWVRNQRAENSSEKWGINVDRIALMFYLANEETEDKKEIAYELNIHLLSRLIRMKLKDVPLVDLASYLNAFLVTCINPRNFHGYDIVQEMRNRVNLENYTNPYVLLALCNAGETLTEIDKTKLKDTFWNVQRTYWTDMQAVVVMALACANKQPGNEVASEILDEMTMELKQQQYRNGTVVNLPTTALVMQALIATDSEKDPDNFDEVKAFEEVLRAQKPDGSFGDFMNTFLVTPVLICKSLVDINSNHCHYGTRDEISALENLSGRSGPKIRVHYSLWIGNEKDLERNLILRVPQNMSLYGVMEIAAEVDSRFKFEYLVKNRKPYINAVSGMRDNPLTGKFWFLYLVQNEKPTLSNQSPADIIVADNYQYIMWYRRGTWVN